VSAQSRDVPDQVSSCFELIVPSHFWSLEGLEYYSGGPSGRSLMNLRSERTDGQSGCSQLSTTSWITMSCESGQHLPLFWAVLQSVTMVSPQDLCASFSRGSRQNLMKRRLIRARSRVTLESAPRLSLSAELRREVARALSCSKAAAWV